jgi:mono/diheme cytochrome c family protein
MKFSVLLFLIICFGCGRIEQYPEGQRLYTKHCSGCHGEQGEGLQELIPPLAGAEIFLAAGPNAACWISNGMEGKIIVKGVEFDNAMPAIKQLSNIEIANILNYSLNSWGNNHRFITPEEIKTIIKSCP